MNINNDKINEIFNITFYSTFEMWYVFYTYRTNAFRLAYGKYGIIF